MIKGGVKALGKKEEELIIGEEKVLRELTRIATKNAEEEKLFTLLASQKSMTEISSEKRFVKNETLEKWLSFLANQGVLEKQGDLFSTTTHTEEKRKEISQLSPPLLEEIRKYPQILRYQRLNQVFVPYIKNETEREPMQKELWLYDAIAGSTLDEIRREYVMEKANLKKNKETYVCIIGQETGYSIKTVLDITDGRVFEIEGMCFNQEFKKAADYVVDIYNIKEASITVIKDLENISRYAARNDYDYVFIFDGLQYFPDSPSLKNITEQVQNILKPEGVFAGTTFFTGEAYDEWINHVIAEFKSYPDKEKFNATLVNSGFKQVKFYEKPWYAFTAKKEK